MNKIQLIIFTLISAGILSIVPIPFVWANIPQEFIQQAEGDLRLGRVDSAIENLARAYILEPQDRAILDRLLRLSSNRQLDTDDRLKLEEIHDLILQLNRIEDDLENYSIQIAALTGILTEQGLDVELIQLEMALLEEQSQKKLGLRLQEAQGLYTDAQQPLQLIAASLKQEHIIMSEKLVLLRSQMDRLKQLPQGETPQIATRMNDNDVEAMKIKHKEFYTLVNKQPEHDPILSSNDPRKQVAALALKLEQTQSKFEEQNAQIRILMSSLDELKSDYMKYDALVNEKNDEISKQNMEIAGLKSQLMLRERLDQENEDSSGSLNSAQENSLGNLEQVNELLKRQLDERNRDLRKLEAMLSIYQEKAEQTSSRKSGVVTISNHASSIASDEKHFMGLLKSKDMNIQEREGQIVELKNIIGMYKLLLGEAKASSLSSNNQVSQYEHQAQLLSALLVKQNQALMDAEYKLLHMKKELSGVQSRFYAFKNLPATKDYAKMEEDLRFIEDDLKNIHTFLLNQLDDFEKLNKDFVAGDLNDLERVLSLDLDPIKSN